MFCWIQSDTFFFVCLLLTFSLTSCNNLSQSFGASRIYLSIITIVPNPVLSPTDQYLAKRRSANHPCPVCGKHYVNEGSLRKHLACHPETQQLASSLRMWPCSVCQAVFTHETGKIVQSQCIFVRVLLRLSFFVFLGLLTHMEHMRMDPKHQFAAQYVLSRAAAERRDRESFIAASFASGSGLLSINTSNIGGGQNSMCASPSAQSDTSSNNERLSSAGSEVGGVGLLNNNNNNNCNNKLSVNDVLRASSNNGHLHNQYGVDEMHANRMAVMAAAANIVNQSNANNANGQSNLNSPTPDSSAAAVQQAVVNLAAAMRMNQVANQNLNNGNPGNNGPSSTTPPTNNDATNAAAQAMLRVSMADTMMSMNHQPHHQQHHQNTPEAAIRMQQQAEAILRTQAEALRLVSQAAAVAASSNNGNNSNVHHNGNNYASNNHPSNQSNNQQQVHQPNQSHQNNPQQSAASAQQNQLNSQVSPELSEALRLHEQRLEQALRLQGGDPRTLGFSLAGQTAQHNP